MNSVKKRLSAVLTNEVIVLFIALYCIIPIYSKTIPITFAEAVPSKKITQYAKDGCLVERVALDNIYDPLSNGRLTRYATVCKRAGAPAVLLIAHGFMSCRADVDVLRLLFPNYSVVTFDFRAHGEAAEGQVCTFGLHEIHELIAAVEYIKSDPDLKDLPLVAFGFSMGAVTAIRACEYYKRHYEKDLFDGMFLDSPFESTEAILERCLEALKIQIFGYQFTLPGVGLLKEYAFNPMVQECIKYCLKIFTPYDASRIPTIMYRLDVCDAASSIDIPVYMVCCYKDDKAPVKAARALYDCFKGFKRVWYSNGRCHCDALFYNVEKYVSKLHSFIESIIDGSIKRKERQAGVRIDNRAEFLLLPT